MSFLLEGKSSFWLTTNAHLVEDTRDTAWAEKHIEYNPAFKWIVARYAEADNPNSNKQFWTLNDLQLGQPSIISSPLNLLHQPRRIVGNFTAAEMIYPMDTANDTIHNPYIETLAVFWKYYFPQELNVIERAHAEGGLTISMECLGESVICEGPEGCGNEFAYAGPKSPSYCDHINHDVSIKHINKPWFVGGGLLVPPVNPGWKQASVTDISELTKEYSSECELAYEGIKELVPNGNSSQWESMMQMVVDLAKSGDKAPAGPHPPYNIKKIGGKYYVVNSLGERKNSKGYDTPAQAEALQKALYAALPPEMKK